MTKYTTKSTGKESEKKNYQSGVNKAKSASTKITVLALDKANTPIKTRLLFCFL